MGINGITGLGTGCDYYAMNSAESADKVIKAFEVAIENGLDPSEVEQEIYYKVNVNPSDFTWYDKQRIQRRVEEMCESRKYNA